MGKSEPCALRANSQELNRRTLHGACARFSDSQRFTPCRYQDLGVRLHQSRDFSELIVGFGEGERTALVLVTHQPIGNHMVSASAAEPIGPVAPRCFIARLLSLQHRAELRLVRCRS